MLAAQRTPERVLGFHNDLLPGWSIAYGLEGICGPDALINPYYRELMDAAGVNRLWDWRYIVEPSETAKLRPDTRYAGTGVQVHTPATTSETIVPMLAFLPRRPRTWTFSRAPPRGPGHTSPTRWRSMETSAEYLVWLKSGRRQALCRRRQDQDWARLQTPPPGLSGALAARSVVPASGYRLTTNSTSFTVRATGPGVIVLTEAYEADNFRAWVNGARVRYIRVNHAFKGIFVNAAGNYDVRFTYWPRGLSESLDCVLPRVSPLLAAALGTAAVGPRAGTQRG